MPAEKHRLPISSLIEIFYGLAIASGIEHLAGLLTGPTPSRPIAESVILGLGAIAVAVGDWAVYNLFIARLEYRRVARILGDMFVIITIFFIFETIEHPFGYMVSIFAYLTLGSSYHYLFWCEYKSLVTRQANLMCGMQATLAMILGVAISVTCIQHRVSSVPPAVLYLAAALGMVWSVVNLVLVDRHLRACAPP